MTRAAAPLLALLALLSGCEVADRVNRPLPETFAVRTSDGRRLTKADLSGKAWVLPLWVPD